MKRRKFLAQTLPTAFGAAPAIFASTRGEFFQNARTRKMSPRVEAVKMAMLTMQRDAWEQGVASQALLEMGEKDLVILMAKEAVVRQLDDGRLAVISSNEGVTDPAANGEPLLFAAEATGDPGLRRAADKMLEYLSQRAPRTQDGTLYHIADKKQVWIDSMYMAPPFLAVAGRPEEAVQQVEGIRKLLWNSDAGLFSQIWDDDLRDFERKDFWGVGNGWAAAGMARIIKAMPGTMENEKKRLAGYVRAVIEGCLRRQRDDGLFHDVLDRPSSFVETNLAQMLAYSIYRGVAGGWLDAAFKKDADRMREAARRKVDGFGLVQGVCGSPNFDSSGTATEGQAFFLLMETAAADLENSA
ncbi:MAG: glycoside hydrolase family 88 protein [Candidatus Aminicenantales bacterium]